MMNGLRVVALAWLAFAATACVDGDGEIAGGSADGGGSQDLGGLGDAVSAVDVAPEASATAVSDTEMLEIAQEITEAGDTGPADVPAPDTQPDAAAPEVSPVDTSKPDAAGVSCLAKVAAFGAARQAALSCTAFWECTVEAPDGPGCACQVHYSSTNLKGQAVLDSEADWKKAGCKPGMCSAPCLDPVASVGLCQPGGSGGSTCKTTAPKCKELEVLAATSLQEGAKCSVDADCTFKVSSTLGCGCPTFVNVKTMGPGKPLFTFMIQLVQSYKVQACTAEVACSCPNPNSATCVAGNCQPKG